MRRMIFAGIAGLRYVNNVCPTLTNCSLDQCLFFVILEINMKVTDEA